MKRVPLLIFVVIALASYAFAPRTSVLAFQTPTYGDCGYPASMTVTDICKVLHDKAVGVVGIAACRGIDCFKENEGHEITMLAEGKPGDFPRIWFASLKPQGGKLDVTTYNCPDCDQCLLLDKGRGVGKPVRVSLSDKNAKPNRCKAERVIGEHLYHEHFASNSAENKRCLAWIECKEDIVK